MFERDDIDNRPSDSVSSMHEDDLREQMARLNLKLVDAYMSSLQKPNRPLMKRGGMLAITALLATGSALVFSNLSDKTDSDIASQNIVSNGKYLGRPIDTAPRVILEPKQRIARQVVLRLLPKPIPVAEPIPVEEVTEVTTTQPTSEPKQASNQVGPNRSIKAPYDPDDY